MIIDCIADLHGYYPKLEGGDLLIVAGDLTARNDYPGYVDFNKWMLENSRIYKKSIIISGNHDSNLGKDKFNVDFPPRVIYLCDSGTEFEGLKIWGSPWSLWFPRINPKCSAFTGNEADLYASYEKTPTDTDILITHGPAYSILDETKDNRHVGSKGLYGWLKYVGRPRLHVFGHIHESYGQDEVFCMQNEKMMLSVNCSIVNENYEHVNEPIRVVL